MRTSCNGCRVLRKGCKEDCIIRPCIQWIKSAESQANATLFLAKFYGRAGLINLINAGPDHLRSAIFKSLLYEACGRIVDPVNGSVGLVYSGNWQHCQSAVDSVLKGTPIMQLQQNDASSSQMINPAYDIRHVSRETSLAPDFHNVRTKTRSKRSRSKHLLGGSSVLQDESMFSVQTVEASSSDPVNPENLNPVFNFGDHIGDNELGLELCLGLPYVVNAKVSMDAINGSDQMDD